MGRGRGLSLRAVVQAASAGRHVVSLAAALLPEDPTWAVAIVGAGLTVGYFLVRRRENNAVERQGAMSPLRCATPPQPYSDPTATLQPLTVPAPARSYARNPPARPSAQPNRNTTTPAFALSAQLSAVRDHHRHRA